MSTIRNAEFEHCLTVFHEKYSESVHALIPEEAQGKLARFSSLSTGVHGWVSTQHGIGFEYTGDFVGIRVDSGSARAEHLLLGVPLRVRKLQVSCAYLDDCREVLFGNCSFVNCDPVRIEGDSSAQLVDCRMASLGWSRNISFAEIHSNRSKDNWSDALASERVLQELLAAKLDLAASRDEDIPIDTYLEAARDRRVLVLGDFGRAESALINSAGL